MTRETFFEKFNQFADAPDAVAKMRQLVLELAVRGRLFPSGQTKPSVSDASAPFPIPGHWRWSTLIEAAEPCGQQKPDARFTYVDVGAIDNLRGRITDAVQRLEAADAPSRARKLVRPGSVLYATVRPYLRNVAILERQFSPPAIVSTAFAVLHPRSILDVRYLFYWLRSQPFQDEVTERMKGVAYPAISDSEFWRCPVPLPPLAEQQQIVAKVDELMALCDQLEAQQQELETRHAVLARAVLARFAEAPTPANLQLLFHPSYAISPADLRKTILTLAVQGKLVSQDPNDEPAEECLSRRGLKITALVPEAETEDPSPQTWVRVRFEDVALVAGGVTLGRKLGERKTVTLPYLRVANVKRGEIDLKVIKEVSIPEGEIERYALRENDLLMTEGGDWDKVGRAAIWRGEIPVCLHQNHVFRARMRSTELTPLWFELYFNSPVGRGYFEFAAKQTTNLASINMRQVRSCPIPFPPLAEQLRIVAKVDELMAMVDQLERQLAASRATAADLLTAAVAELTSTVMYANNEISTEQSV